MKKQKSWCFAPNKAQKVKVPEKVRVEVEVKARELVDSFLKPIYIKKAPSDGCSLYTDDIYTKWYRNYFYFCSKEVVGRKDMKSVFLETKFARLEYIGDGLFNLSYMRHTGKWLEIYASTSLEECLIAVKDDYRFIP